MSKSYMNIVFYKNYFKKSSRHCTFGFKTCKFLVCWCQPQAYRLRHCFGHSLKQDVRGQRHTGWHPQLHQSRSNHWFLHRKWDNTLQSKIAFLFFIKKISSDSAEIRCLVPGLHSLCHDLWMHSFPTYQEPNGQSKCHYLRGPCHCVPKDWESA